MSAGLQDLLDKMRQHPAFPELLQKLEPPPLRGFKPSGGPDQASDWIFRSGRSAQHANWVRFLTEGEAPNQEKT